MISKQRRKVGLTERHNSILNSLSTPRAFWSCDTLYLRAPTVLQPFVRDYMVQHHSSSFKKAFGQRRANSMMEATAGSVVGVGEVGDVNGDLKSLVDRLVSLCQ